MAAVGSTRTCVAHDPLHFIFSPSASACDRGLGHFDLATLIKVLLTPTEECKELQKGTTLTWLRRRGPLFGEEHHICLKCHLNH